MLIKNYRSLLLTLFVITLAGGSFMLEFKAFGVTLYAFRVLLIIGLPVLLFKKQLTCYTNKVSKYTFFFLITWLVYSAISLIWSMDKMAAGKDILYLLFGIASFVFLISLKKGYADFDKELSSAWGLVFIVVILVSVWEIYTANHLVSNFTQRLYDMKPFHILHYVPVFTFDNPNHFAIYCCISVIIFSGAILRKSQPALNGFLIANSIFIIHLSKARLGIITLFIFGVIAFFYVFLKKNEKDLRQKLMPVIKFVMIAIFLIGSVFCFHPYENVNEKIITPESISKDDHLASTVLRKNLLMNGMLFLKQSKGLGVGPGNYQAYTNAGLGPYETDGIDSPHNWPMEILSQWGIGITALFLALFIYILAVLFRSVKRSGFQQKHFLLLLLLVCYAIMSNANSIFMPLPLNWFMLSLIVIWSDELLENNLKGDA